MAQPNHQRLNELYSRVSRAFIPETVCPQLDGLWALPELDAWKTMAEQELAGQDMPDSDDGLSAWFFPQGGPGRESVQDIRARRLLHRESPAADPVTDIPRQVLFTSNVLLTLPADASRVEPSVAARLDMAEPQKFWYDHPIPLDVPDAANELLYGLQRFNETARRLGWEKVDMLLSVSCTHNCVKAVARDYVTGKLRQAGLDRLRVYLFTEEDCQTLLSCLWEGCMAPADLEGIREVFGADGNYGRHYTLLKALAPLWKRAFNSQLKAVFKIDLDQTFFEEDDLHGLMSDRWGGTAVDEEGRRFYLGGVAGRLVNQEDAEISCRILDVKQPPAASTLEQKVFYSQIPQHTSTEAEMGIFEQAPDEAWRRIHITGGMNGVRIDALEEYRPFTPGFITRAEDQSFLFSAMETPVDGCFLRYVHEPDLMMRHDKNVFLRDMLTDHQPVQLGDFERTLLFSHYVNDILASERLRRELQPFTGCFVSRIPTTLVLFRLFMRAGDLAAKGQIAQAQELMQVGAARLVPILTGIRNGAYRRQFEREKNSWNLYYDALRQPDLPAEALRDCLTRLSV